MPNRVSSCSKPMAWWLGSLLVVGWLASATSTASAQEFNARIRLMNGSELVGQVQGLTSESCQFAPRDSGVQQISVDDIAEIQALDDIPPSRGLPLTLETVDGSLLRAQSMTSAGNVVRLEGGSCSLELETRNIRWIRFQSLDLGSELATSWNELIAQELTSDILVVRRETDGQVRLNPVEGVVGDWDTKLVRFKFDDSEIEVPVERVDAMIYYHPPGRRLSELRGIVTTQQGDSFRIRNWESTAEQLVVTLTSGVAIEVPWTEIDRVDWESGRVQSLVDLEPATLEWAPYIVPSGDPQRLEQLRTLFAIERDQSFSGEPLSLYSASGFQGTGDRTRLYSRGLALRSETRLVYRVPDGYQRLVGIFGLDPTVRPRGNVTIAIQGDGRDLWQGSLSGEDDEPTPIDLDITGVARLSIKVGFGTGGDLGDRVHWCEPRLLK